MKTEKKKIGRPPGSKNLHKHESNKVQFSIRLPADLVEQVRNYPGGPTNCTETALILYLRGEK